MATDIFQLPIPSWGLLCPSCRYELKGLPEHRCPECGLALDMQRIVKTWHRLRDPIFTGNELPVPDFGLQCLACKHDLAGAERHQCRNCDRPFDLQALRPRTEWFAVTANMGGTIRVSAVNQQEATGAATNVVVDPVRMPLLESMLEAENVPFFTHDAKTMYDIVFGGRAHSAKVVVAAEFYFDFLFLVRRTAREIAEVRLLGDTAEWKCPQCRESVPGHFDLCWNCQFLRIDAE